MAYTCCNLVTGNTATVGFGVYGYSGLITLLALVLVETEPKFVTV